MKRGASPARRGRPRTLCVWLVLAAFLLGWAAIARAENGETLERRVKAAFVYRMLEYVEWPAAALGESGTPLVIGVAGADEMAAELEQVTAGRGVRGHPIAIRRLGAGDLPAGLHVVFVGRALRERLPEIARAAAPRAALVVSDAPGALAQGSVVNFVIVDGRVRFEVALDAAERSGLRLSARLLSVALQVQGGP